MSWLLRSGTHKRRAAIHSILDGLLESRSCQSDAAPGLLATPSLLISSSCSGLHDTPATSRAASTKRTVQAPVGTAVPFEKYLRVVRRPTEKAKVFNRTNWQAWHDSGLDIGLAKQFLAELELSGRQSSPSTAGKAIVKLIRDASKLGELQLLVEELQGAMQVEEALRVMDKAVFLMSQELQTDSTKWSHHDTVKQQAASIVDQAANQVVGQLLNVSTPQLAGLLYCLGRAGVQRRDVQQGAADELTANKAYRLAEADARVVAALLRSAACLGWHRSEKAAWAALSSTAAASLHTLEPEHVAHVVSGVCIANDQAGQLGSTLLQHVTSNVQAWARSYPVAVSDMLFTLARFGTRPQRPLVTAVGDVATDLAGSRTLSNLPPTTLARLAYGVAVLGVEGGSREVAVDSLPPASRACVALTQQILSTAGANILKMSVPDMCHLLQAQLHCPRGSWQDMTAANLVKGVLLARGVKTSQQLGPAVRLIHLLHQLGLPVTDLIMVLSKQLYGRLSVLSPGHISTWMSVLHQHSAAPLPAAEFFTAALPHLQRAVQDVAGRTAAAEGLAVALQVARSVPDGQVAPAGLTAAVKELGDALAGLPPHSWQGVRQGVRQQLQAALKAAGLQDHPLYAALA